jgi:hypothetical protein
MRRVYIETITGGIEGGIKSKGGVIPGGVEVWFNPDTGAIFKRALDGALWGHLLEVLGRDCTLREFDSPPPEKSLAEILTRPEAPAPVSAIVEAPEGMVNPPKTGARGPYKKKAKRS